MEDIVWWSGKIAKKNLMAAAQVGIRASCISYRRVEGVVALTAGYPHYGGTVVVVVGNLSWLYFT